MGAIYKRKRRSCKMCKPYKMGFEDKKKLKERTQVEEFETIKRKIMKGEIDESLDLG